MAITIGTGSISFDGTAFRAADLTDLKAGKSIATDTNKKFVNSADDTTYIRMGTSAKAWHYINNQPILKLGVGNITIGDSSTSTTFGSAGITGGMVVTGSTELSGSCTVSGSFTVTDLLNVLGNYGQTGSFSISGSTTLAGDVNADGQVTVQDLLTVLGGFGASGDCEVSGSLTISGSNVAGSPPALVITGSTEFTGSTSVDGPFVVGNLLDLLANYGATGIPTGSGEGGVSVGDINLDGQVNVTDLLLLLGGMGNPNIIVSNLTIPPNTNYQLIGPEISISQDVVVTVGTNSFLQIT